MASLFDDFLILPRSCEPELFSAWWELYRDAIRPRPIRDRAACLGVWRRAGWTELQQKAMLVKLQAQVDHRRRCKAVGEFCPALPDPIRYFKRKLWKEEL